MFTSGHGWVRPPSNQDLVLLFEDELCQRGEIRSLLAYLDELLPQESTVLGEILISLSESVHVLKSVQYYSLQYQQSVLTSNEMKRRVPRLIKMLEAKIDELRGVAARNKLLA